MTDSTQQRSRQERPRIRVRSGDLEEIHLFAHLPEETLQMVAERGSVRKHREGAVLFLEGHPAVEAHFLLSGQLKVVRDSEDGQEVILRLIQPGEMFGAAGGWGSPVYPATAIAMEDARVFRLPAGEITALIGHSPEFALAVIQELSGRLREAETRIRELQAERVERRIARTLLRLAGKIGQPSPEGIRIDLPQSRQHLAELSGATLSTVSRVLSDWDRQGLVLAGRERVTIVAPHDLVMIAEDTNSVASN